MRLRQLVIDLESMHGCRLSVLANFLRGNVARITQEIIGIGKTRIGQSVLWISLNRLLEIINRPGKASFGPLVPVIETLKVELISLWVLGVVLGELRGLLAGQFGSQVVVNLLRDVFLNAEQISDLAIVLSAPQFRTIGNADQVSLNRQGIPTLGNASQQHSVDTKLLAHFLRAEFSAFVAEHGAASHDPHLGKSGKAADDSFG